MSPASSRFSRARILIIDDSPLQVRLVSMALAKVGFLSIETAADGEEGLEKTRRFEPDMVILDLSMPKLDGYGYCEQVRSDPKIARMPILVQTAMEEREAKLRALSCGADDFLHKPLDADELALRVHIHLERYFMLQDTNEMCLYLKMELEQAHTMLWTLQESSAPPAAMKMLNRHYDVLREMTVIPLFAKK